MVSSLDVFDSQWRARLLALNICEPAKVVSFNEAERTCVVAPAFLIGTRAGEEPRMTITDVPVLFPVIGGLSAQYDLIADDDVLLVYTQRDVLKWWEDGEAALPENNRLFGTPVAIPVAREGELRDMRLERGSTVIEMTGDRVTITGDLYVNGVIRENGDLNIHDGNTSERTIASTADGHGQFTRILRRT